VNRSAPSNDRSELAAELAGLLARAVGQPVEPRAMFGGHGFYCAGRFLALHWKGALYVKARRADAAELARLGWERFVPFPDRPARRGGTFHYWAVPDSVAADPARLRPFALRALEAASAVSEPRRALRRRAAARERLLNLGPASRRWLDAVGVRTRADLERLGAARAYARVVEAGFRPTLNLLWALEGALMDLHWSRVPAAVREALRARVAALAERAPSRRRAASPRRSARGGR
jgi:TfoX/Sxy family transcriptional regulator of competence genes